jgi:uroporphyrin-III C-methyltransferase
MAAAHPRSAAGQQPNGRGSDLRDAGKVYLVGAGPGDPGLLTLKAHALLQSGDALVYDRLVSMEILDMVPPGVTRIDVGKQPGHHPVPQEDINEILISLAKAGRSVVRLKGGDPLMFGRGGEEALALQAAGIPFEVVPGITAAQGTAAASMVPLTYRGVASSVRYLTGHCRGDTELDFDWDGLADPDTTLVVYMGLSHISEISTQLIAHGRAACTPVMAVSKATRTDERKFVAMLGSISQAVDEARLQSPVLFIIGEVVSLSKQLGIPYDAIHIDHMAAAE